jgi:hypothetical protein
LTPLDVNGDTLIRGDIFFAQGAVVSKSATGTLTGAEVLSGIIQSTGAAITLTMPSATNINSAIPFVLPTDHAFEFTVINTGTGVVTMAGATGTATVGTLTVPTSSSARFRVRKTGTTTYTMYRV